jgi:hypothetical protein
VHNTIEYETKAYTLLSRLAVPNGLPRTIAGAQHANLNLPEKVQHDASSQHRRVMMKKSQWYDRRSNARNTADAAEKQPLMHGDEWCARGKNYGVLSATLTLLAFAEQIVRTSTNVW